MDEETERLHLRTEEEAPKTSQSIKQVRFKKEMDTIRLQHEFELKEHSDGSKDIVFLLNYKLMERLPLVIHLHKDYPFVEPQYTFNPPDVPSQATLRVSYRQKIAIPKNQFHSYWGHGAQAPDCPKSPSRQSQKLKNHS